MLERVFTVEEWKCLESEREKMPHFMTAETIYIKHYNANLGVRNVLLAQSYDPFFLSPKSLDRKER